MLADKVQEVHEYNVRYFNHETTNSCIRFVDILSKVYEELKIYSLQDIFSIVESFVSKDYFLLVLP